MSFVYGPDNERWKSVMNRPVGGTRTIYYMGDCEKIVENGHTRRLYYLDDDAIFIKQDNLSGSIYFTFKDNLGSIVAIVDYNGNEVFKAAYDAWGNRTLYRNDINFHRGYTGHEMLPEFSLINMNGRLYDPLLGRFLSTDNFVQEPTNSQNFNRYTYCLNNPLKYTDPSGEWAFLDDGIAMLVGGVINLGINLLQGNVNSFGQGVSLFAVGAASAEAALYTGPFAPFVTAAITSVGNDVVNQSFNNGSINWDNVGYNLMMSEIMAGFSYGLNLSWGHQFTNYVSGKGISSPVANNMMSQSLLSGAIGATIDGTFTLMNGGNGREVFNAALRGGGVGFVSGAASGLGEGLRTSYKNGINPWTGKFSPYKKGLIGVEKARAEFINNGGDIVGNEVTVEVDGVRNRFDLVGVKDGKIYLIEVKNGANAKMTKNQSINIPKLQNHRSSFIPIGGNAGNIKEFIPYIQNKTPFNDNFDVIYRQFY